ncbi:sporulation integral membrane protein YtvI [Acetivibrio cellulolyticus]|uniref:sporulation integral membrane protein YtvI n=1 Tax=Acetivibrio cellulolyticus TaxID=35830 RepID=UPI0001E2F5C9|nr:sporulation integral membrane protein YtvI [Acetivibrio cellulolyticus]
MLTIFKRYGNQLASILIVAGLLFGAYVGIKYVIAFLAPFILAVIISSINEPVVRFLESKAKMDRKAASISSLILSVCVIAAIAVLVLFKTYGELIKLQRNLPAYIDSSSYILSGYYSRINSFYNNLPYQVQSSFRENLLVFLPKIEGLITSIATSIINSITSLPKLGVFTTVTLLSSYFISSDRKNIRNFIYRQIPNRSQKNFYTVKNGTVSSIFGYFRAQMIIMTVTFVVSTLGFIIINTEYAVLMGLITALADGIPLLGSGIVMIPWIIWNFITGNIRMGLGLSSVYLFAVIVRQIIEPKIVSNQTGLHPLVTLISMYLGLMIFGVTGLFIGPIIMIFLKSLHSSGVVTIWNESP